MARLPIGLMLALLFVIGWSTDAESAYRVHFRHGGTLELDSYEERGDSLSYHRFGGVIAVPKASILRVETFPSAQELGERERERARQEELERQQREAAKWPSLPGPPIAPSKPQSREEPLKAKVLGKGPVTCPEVLEIFPNDDLSTRMTKKACQRAWEEKVAEEQVERLLRGQSR